MTKDQEILILLTEIKNKIELNHLDEMLFDELIERVREKVYDNGDNYIMYDALIHSSNKLLKTKFKLVKDNNYYKATVNGEDINMIVWFISKNNWGASTGSSTTYHTSKNNAIAEIKDKAIESYKLKQIEKMKGI